MFIRFESFRKNEEADSCLGVFQAAFDLRKSGGLALHEEEWLAEELAWLKMHLISPDILRDEGTQRAISWFKPNAARAIEKVRSIAALLEQHGVLVRMKKTNDPGVVIYEDRWQVVAIPHRRKHPRYQKVEG